MDKRTERVYRKGREWVKGQSGNPKGRPKKLPGLDELLAKTLGTIKGGHTEAENILLAMIKAAKKGDVRAAELLIERGYGKLGIRIDVMAGRQNTADLFPDELKFFTTGGQTLTDDGSNIRQLQPYIRQEADQSEPKASN